MFGVVGGLWLVRTSLPYSMTGTEKKAVPASAKAASFGEQSDKEATKKELEDEELSEEDLKLKEELDMLVERLTESNTQLHRAALDALTGLIRTSTTSMTAVPKPLKFLKPHYAQLVEVWESWPASVAKNQLAGILSVLGMTQGTALKYRLLVQHSGDEQELAAWGHEYLRHLALEIGDDFHSRLEDDTSLEADNGDLLDLALRIVPFFLKHNAETDAVDLLLEVDSVERMADEGLMDAETYPRVCQYLVAAAAYLDTESAAAALHTAYSIYKQHNEAPQALLLAIRLDNEELVRSVFADTHDTVLRKQLAFIVARQRRFYDLSNESGELPDDIAEELRNTHLSGYFAYLAKELNLQKFKTPHEVLRSPGDTGVFKVHSERSKMTLATIFVRGLINAGYSNFAEDFEETAVSTSRSRPANISALQTSLGLGYLWNYHVGLQEIEPYVDSTDRPTKAGTALAVGVVTTGVHDESDAALGLLTDLLADVHHKMDPIVGTAAVLGLGLSYAGTAREELIELLEPIVTDHSLPIEVSAIAAVALGFIFVGSANGYLTTSVLEAFIERDHKDLGSSWAVFLGLGLALLYIGKFDKIDATVEAIKAIEHPVSQSVETLLVICAYAGSGNVLQIQRLLRETATRHYEEEDEDEDIEEGGDGASNAIVAALKKAANSEQFDPALEVNASVAELAEDAEQQPSEFGENSVERHTGKDAEQSEQITEQPAGKEEHDARENQEDDPSTKHESAKAKGLCALGIGLIAMGENIGEEMVMRHLEHLMHYGDLHIKQAVPLAMGLISTSNPQMKVYETLSRYTHELQFSVANNAIFALGLVGAGTLNARVAQLLRQLDEYYSRSSELSFMSRFANGLVNLGKGTITLSPFNAEKQLLSPVSLAGLLTVSIALLMPSSKQFFISEHPSLLYCLTLAMQPRMLVTVDENLKPIKVTVRVGQAVDTVGQAGKPKKITGWVTQDTPVLLSAGERVELEDDDYIPLTSTLEGIVILRKRED